MVLYKERQIFKTSFPSPSLFSTVHLVSITVASLTHGLLVMLLLREENARHWERMTDIVTTGMRNVKKEKKWHLMK